MNTTFPPFHLSACKCGTWLVSISTENERNNQISAFFIQSAPFLTLHERVNKSVSLHDTLCSLLMHTHFMLMCHRYITRDLVISHHKLHAVIHLPSEDQGDAMCYTGEWLLKISLEVEMQSSILVQWYIYAHCFS